MSKPNQGINRTRISDAAFLEQMGLTIDDVQDITVPALISRLPRAEYENGTAAEVEERKRAAFVSNWYSGGWFRRTNFRDTESAADYLVDFGLVPDTSLAAIVLNNTVATERIPRGGRYHNGYPQELYVSPDTYILEESFQQGARGYELVGFRPGLL